MYGKPKCFDPELQSFLADYKAMRDMGTCNDFLAKKVQDIRQRNDVSIVVTIEKKHGQHFDNLFSSTMKS